MENYHSRSGITISLPPFNPETDQLFRSIKSLFEQKIYELHRRLEKVENTQINLCNGLSRLESLLSRTVMNNQVPKFPNRPILTPSYSRHVKQVSSKRNISDFEVYESNDSFGVQAKRMCTSMSSQQLPILQPKDTFTDINKTKSNDEDDNDIVITKTESLSEGSNSFTPIDFQNNSNNFLSSPTPVSYTSSRGSSSNVDASLCYSPAKNPVVVYNPETNKEIFIGGDSNWRMPYWIYVRCLQSLKENKLDASPKLALRLIQAIFGREYTITHNFGGTFGKEPIDPSALRAIFEQTRLQFNTDHFYTDPVALSKFRVYVNNSFRVMLFNLRRNKPVRLSTWDADGRPITSLDPPPYDKLPFQTISEGYRPKQFDQNSKISNNSEPEIVLDESNGIYEEQQDSAAAAPNDHNSEA